MPQKASGRAALSGDTQLIIATFLCTQSTHLHSKNGAADIL